MLHAGSMASAGLGAGVRGLSVTVKVRIACHCERWIVGPYVLSEMFVSPSPVKGRRTWGCCLTVCISSHERGEREKEERPQFSREHGDSALSSKASQHIPLTLSQLRPT
ncbi:unnamed protein product [Ectocarpus sp. CCAP 1310/34]|nr:unnamed protein product [Ectocarpus sp. CCAP 1310/34]